MPETDLQLLAVMYTTGGRRAWQTHVAVFAQNGKSLVKAFEGLVASSDATGSGHVWQTVVGHLLYSAPGETGSTRSSGTRGRSSSSRCPRRSHMPWFRPCPPCGSMCHDRRRQAPR